MKRRDAEEGTRRKKRKWVLPVSIIAGVFLLCLVVTGVLFVTALLGDLCKDKRRKTYGGV